MTTADFYIRPIRQVIAEEKVVYGFETTPNLENPHQVSHIYIGKPILPEHTNPKPLAFEPVAKFSIKISRPDFQTESSSAEARRRFAEERSGTDLVKLFREAGISIRPNPHDRSTVMLDKFGDLGRALKALKFPEEALKIILSAAENLNTKYLGYTQTSQLKGTEGASKNNPQPTA